MASRAGFVGYVGRVGQAIKPMNLSYVVDFTSGSLPSPLTFTRASTAQYFDSTGTQQTAAINAARFDYNPVGLTARGLILEPTSTNRLPNSTMQGASVGNYPTTWAATGTAGNITPAVVAVGTEFGMAYIDVQLSGTSNAATNVVVANFCNTTNGAISPNQPNTSSVYWRIVGGSTANITSVVLNHRYQTSAGVLVSQINSSELIGSLSSTLNRVQFTDTPTDATIAFNMPRIFAFFNNAVTVDLTIRIYAPQLEPNLAYATSFIPTTTAALSRSSDVATYSDLSNIGYNASEGTFVIEFEMPSAINGTLLSVSDGSQNNILYTRMQAVGTARHVVTVGGVSVGFNTANSYTFGTVGKVAFGYRANDHGVCLNGGTVATDTTSAVPTVSALKLFRNGVDGERNLGWVRRITYYPTRLPNSQLQALTL